MINTSKIGEKPKAPYAGWRTFANKIGVTAIACLIPSMASRKSVSLPMSMKCSLLGVSQRLGWRLVPGLAGGDRKVQGAGLLKACKGERFCSTNGKLGSNFCNVANLDGVPVGYKA